VHSRHPLPDIGDAAIVNMPEEDRATDKGNMQQEFGKYRACGFRDRPYPSGQTDTQT